MATDKLNYLCVRTSTLIALFVAKCKIYELHTNILRQNRAAKVKRMLPVTGNILFTFAALFCCKMWLVKVVIIKKLNSKCAHVYKTL